MGGAEQRRATAMDNGPRPTALRAAKGIAGIGSDLQSGANSQAVQHRATVACDQTLFHLMSNQYTVL